MHYGSPGRGILRWFPPAGFSFSATNTYFWRESSLPSSEVHLYYILIASGISFWSPPLKSPRSHRTQKCPLNECEWLSPAPVGHLCWCTLKCSSTRSAPWGQHYLSPLFHRLDSCGVMGRFVNKPFLPSAWELDLQVDFLDLLCWYPDKSKMSAMFLGNTACDW